MAITILEATVSAADTSSFKFRRGDTLPLMIATNGLGAGEYATIQYYNGAAWKDYILSGEVNPVRVTSDNTPVHIWPSAGMFRASKSVTAAPTAIYLHLEIDQESL